MWEGIQNKSRVNQSVLDKTTGLWEKMSCNSLELHKRLHLVSVYKEFFTCKWVCMQNKQGEEAWKVDTPKLVYAG